MKTVVKIGLAAGALYVAYKVALKNFTVNVKDIAFKGIDLNKGIAQILINLSVKNPLPFGVTIKDVQGDIYAQGVKVGYVNTEYNYLMAGESVHILPLYINLSSAGVGEALWKNIQTGNINTLKINFSGKIRITKINIGIPLDLSFDYKELVG